MRSEVVVALDAELSAVVELLRAVDESGFTRPTNCPPWTLKELAVHINGTTRLPAQWTASDDPPRPAADYYRRPERSTTEYRDQNVAHAQRAATRFPSGAEVMRQIDQSRAEIAERLNAEDLQQVVVAPNLGAMTIEGYVSTRVLAAAAHALDVAITLDVPREPSRSALNVCTPILVDLLGERPSSDLSWSDADFFRQATGRGSLDERDMAILGQRARDFPLVS